MMAKAGAGGGGGKKGGKGGGGGGDPKDDKGEHGLGVTPINYLKDGKDPSVMPDEDYPEWLWNMQVGGWAKRRDAERRSDRLSLFCRGIFCCCCEPWRTWWRRPIWLRLRVQRKILNFSTAVGRKCAHCPALPRLTRQGFVTNP